MRVHDASPRQQRQTLRAVLGLIVSLSLPLAPALLEAQTDNAVVVTGKVVSSETGEPIQGAIVEVVALNLQTRTDAQGRFRLAGVPIGRHEFRVRQLGFRALVLTVGVPQPGQAELGRLELTAGTPVLEGVVVEAEPTVRHLAQVGFYERKESEVGAFVERKQLRAWAPRVTTDVLRHMPGIRVLPNPNYGRDLPPPRSAMGFVLGPSPGRDLRRFLIYSTRAPSAEQCPPLYFVDGVYVGDGLTVDLDSHVSAAQLDAVEYYSGSGRVPARFNRPGSACGVLVLWRRVGQ